MREEEFYLNEAGTEIYVDDVGYNVAEIRTLQAERRSSCACVFKDNKCVEACKYHGQLEATIKEQADMLNRCNNKETIAHMHSGWADMVAEIEQLKAQNKLLTNVSNAAAVAVIDLGSNLHEAHEEYMSGKIAKGAFDYVLGRHGNLLQALRDAGYTEKNPMFDFPVKPTIHDKGKDKES